MISARQSYFLGLGGNLGNVAVAMRDTLEFLDAQERIDVVQISPVYQTPPWGLSDQPDFLNACVEISTDLEPEALLDVCQSAEKRQMRKRDIRWGPRTIDVDILFGGAANYQSDRLTIPHPHMLERTFVLVPLADIAGDIKISGKSILHWRDRLDISGIKFVGNLEELTAPQS